MYYGPSVEKELEKEYAKLACSAESCNQNVAIAFNGELIADGSVTKLGGGYLIKVVVRNVISGEVIETVSQPCRGCDVFAVVERLNLIGLGKSHSAVSSVELIARPIQKAPEAAQAILVFDSKPSGALVRINRQVVGGTPYQGMQHQVGQQLKLTLSKPGYTDRTISVRLDKAINHYNTVQLNVADGTQGDTEFFILRTLHPSGSLSASGNKVVLSKVARVNGVTTTDDIKVLGTFVSKPRLYSVTYERSSDPDAPKAGHDVLAYYKGSPFEGYSERYMYASLSIKGQADKVQADIRASMYQQYASNFSGSLKNNGSFWTRLTPAAALYDELKALAK